MRTLFLLRGTPAAGKTTWIQQNKLEPYTLSADNIRLMFQGPILNNNGNFIISQKNDSKVWELLIKMLEERMQKGEFVIVDATHYKSELINKYKKLIEKYRYRAYIIDFTDVPLETTLKRNEQREEYKKVPEETIRKMYAVFKSNMKEIANRFTVLSPEKAIEMLYTPTIFDFNKYDKIVVFGDIHGCYEPLKEYFDQNPFDENIAYIFTGDYLDRGIQNKEVLEWLIQHRQYKNVLLLEGNHEIWLRMYAEDNGADKEIVEDDYKTVSRLLGKQAVNELKKKKIRNKGFIKDTIPQIEQFDKKELRQLCRQFGQMAYINYGTKKYFISHGGISCLPSIFVPAEDFIKGTGKYEDINEIYKSWATTCPVDTVMIHAHRNVFGCGPNPQPNIYNLCDEIEFGKNLRILEISKNNQETVILIKNNIYDENLIKKQKEVTTVETHSENEILKSLNESKNINKKILKGNLISYNFSREAFSKRRWNETTCKARGLFIDPRTETVAARSYDKFFNWGEQIETETKSLSQNLKFPVYAYRKENGFLALLSWDNDIKDIRFCSKSTNEGPYVEILKDVFNELPQTTHQAIKEYLSQHNHTLVFECVNPIADPHIINYDKNHLYLLDIIENTFETKRTNYQDICAIADMLGVEHKILETVFFSFDELYSFKKSQESSYEIRHEGWVFEDSAGFMLKFKTRFYNFWKYMRKLQTEIINNRNIQQRFTSEAEVKAYALMQSLHKENKLAAMNILEVEKIFYSNF